MMKISLVWGSRALVPGLRPSTLITRFWSRGLKTIPGRPGTGRATGIPPTEVVGAGLPEMGPEGLAALGLPKGAGVCGATTTGAGAGIGAGT